MILKNRKEPPDIFQLQSLVKRIPVTHSQFPHWTEQLRRITAGFHGEQRVDSLWHEIELPSPYFFIHDLFIQQPNSSFQMDTVLVTSRFILILEIKSISGLLNFDPQTRQFSRTNKDGSIDGMRNPDDQLRRHEKWMKRFLADRQFELPVLGAIVFTYPSSVIQSKAGKRIIIQSSGLPYLMEQLLSNHPYELLSDSATSTLSQNLLNLHSAKELVLPTLPDAVLTGVLCPHCVAQRLAYVRKSWRCNVCSYKNAKSHLDALAEYRHLVSRTITNREFRHFMHLPSITTASKLLKSSKMRSTGSYKDRVYFIPEQIALLESISPGTDSIRKT
ncbi:Nuclease-related domain protein [Planococcus massiliensis]|uniref:Nuclease-related domain protein n=1 Tax=Planococcus massiliensis TaxID=1499687 RepID=A0A098EKW3_9BACL|nr:nuclease-related domain-containing protein [Planococcus massiliensis]CEG21856.1 Nuclease-related domain protein [Planococcus massiliensis]